MIISPAGNITKNNYSKADMQESNIAAKNINLNNSGRINGQLQNDKDVQKTRLKEACTQFEQIFIKYMVDKMWSSTEITGGKQSVEKSVWQDFFNDEISKVLAESSLTGMSQTLFEQLASTLPEEETPIVDTGNQLSGADEIMGTDKNIKI